MNEFNSFEAAGFRQSSMACTAKAARKLLFESVDEETPSPVQDTGSLAWRNTNEDMECFDMDLTKSYDFSDCSETSLTRDDQPWEDTPRRYVVEAEMTESVSVTFTARRYARLELEADDYGQMTCRESSGSTNISASKISHRHDRELSHNFQSLMSVMDGLNIDHAGKVDSDLNLTRSPDVESKAYNDVIQDRIYGSSLKVEQCDALRSDLSSQRCQNNVSGRLFEQYQTTASNLNVEQCNVLPSGLNSALCPSIASGVHFEQFQSEAASLHIENYQATSTGLKGVTCYSSRDDEATQTSNCVLTTQDLYQHHEIRSGVKLTNLECNGTSYQKNDYSQPSSPISNFQNFPTTDSISSIQPSSPLRSDQGVKQNQPGDPSCTLSTVWDFPVNQKSDSSNCIFGTSESEESVSPQIYSRRSESMKCVNSIRDPPTKINFRTSSSQESCLSVDRSTRVDNAEAYQVEKEELETIKYMLRNCELFHPLDMEPKMPRPTPDHSPVRSLMDGGDAVDVRGLANRLSYMKSEGRMRYALKQYVHSHIPSMQGKMDDIIENTIQQIANVSLGGDVSRPPNETTLSAITTSEAWLKLGNCREAVHQQNSETLSEVSSLDSTDGIDGIVELHGQSLDHHPVGNGSKSRECTSERRPTSELTRVIHRKTSEARAKERCFVNSQGSSTTDRRLTSDRKRKRKIREVTGESTRKGKKRVSFAFTEDECSDVVRCKRAYLD